MIASESAEFARAPFGVAQMKFLSPLFLRSFAVTRWYCFGIIWVFIGIAFSKRGNLLILYPALLMLGYIGVYSSHVRSYYQAFYGSASPFDAIRYSMNLMTLWALLVGFGIERTAEFIWACNLPKSRKRVLQVVSLAGCLVYGTLAYKYARDLREDLTGEEYSSRIAGAKMAYRLSKTVRGSIFVVTPEPLLLQIYGDSTTNVIALTSFDLDLVVWLKSHFKDLVIEYVDYKTYRNAVDLDRYRRPVTDLERFSRDTLFKADNFEIVKLGGLLLDKTHVDRGALIR